MASLLTPGSPLIDTFQPSGRGDSSTRYPVTVAEPSRSLTGFLSITVRSVVVANGRRPVRRMTKGRERGSGGSARVSGVGLDVDGRPDALGAAERAVGMRQLHVLDRHRPGLERLDDDDELYVAG